MLEFWMLFNTRNAASGAAIARRVSKNRHCKGMLKDWPFIVEEGMWYAREEGSTQVATVVEKLPKAERAGLGRVGTGWAGGGVEAGSILQGQQRDVDIAGPTTADNVLQVRQRKGTIAGPTKARMCFGGIKFVRRIRKPWEGKRPAGGWNSGNYQGDIHRGENILMKTEVSVGLVRRRLKDQRRTDIGGISRTVIVGRGRRARRRHTEVRSSYHFRVRTK
ncbi:hypothetical protein BY996DRAFT_6608985 [Phakopsora pachyrhizi]|nr:hypothetical protein BY996DRAFT_6608985 [Phakopsora pachyrhizi]